MSETAKDAKWRLSSKTAKDENFFCGFSENAILVINFAVFAVAGLML